LRKLRTAVDAIREQSDNNAVINYNINAQQLQNDAS